MKNLKKIAMMITFVIICTAVMSQNTISVNWTKSISGQKITGASGLYTVSIPTNISTIPFAYEVDLWDAGGNHNKVSEGTTLMPPKILSFNGKLLVNRGQSESVKIMSSTGTVITEKTIPATLPTPCLSSETKYFYTGNVLVRASYTITPTPGGQYSSKVEVFTDELVLVSSKEIIGMQFVNIAGDFLIGNVDGKGQIVSITGTTTKDLTSAITGVSEKNGNLFVLADKLYKLDSQLTEAWNKSITGSALNFIADKAVVFNGTSAILYDSLFNSSLFTLTVNQSGLIGINATSDAIYVATSNTLAKIILGGSTPDGIEDIMNASSIILYPNPTVDQISIKGLDNPTIEILNANGQLLMTEQNTTINVSHLPAGLYLCKIGGKLTRQFIKK